MAKYSLEFKRDAVALVHQGATQSQVCRDLGISKSSLSNWVTDAHRKELGLPTSGEVTTSEEDARVRDLIKRNRLLEQENEVLRRAAAYLSQIHITRPK